MAATGKDAGPLGGRAVEDHSHVISGVLELLRGDQGVDCTAQVTVRLDVREYYVSVWFTLGTFRDPKYVIETTIPLTHRGIYVVNSWPCTVSISKLRFFYG